MKNLLQHLLLTSVLLASAAFAQTVDPQNVLVRNVYLIDGGDATKGVLVNLLLSGILDKTGHVPLGGEEVCFELASWACD